MQLRQKAMDFFDSMGYFFSPEIRFSIKYNTFLLEKENKLVVKLCCDNRKDVFEMLERESELLAEITFDWEREDKIDMIVYNALEHYSKKLNPLSIKLWRIIYLYQKETIILEEKLQKVWKTSNIIQDWQKGKIKSKGYVKLDWKYRTYELFLSGCKVNLENKILKYEYGLDCRVDGFTMSNLYDYIIQNEFVKLFNNEDIINLAFSELLKEKIIKHPEWEKNTNIYYLSSDLEELNLGGIYGIDSFTPFEPE